RFTFGICAPRLIDGGVRFGQLGIVFMPEREQRVVLQLGPLGGWYVKRFGYEEGERLQLLVAIGDAEAESAQEVVGAAVGVGSTVLEAKRDLETGAVSERNRFVEAKLG